MSSEETKNSATDDAGIDSGSDIRSFNQNHVYGADDASDEIATISRIASHVDQNDPNNVLHRLETLSKQLSNVTTRNTFTIDPSDFDLAQLLKGYLKNAGKGNVKLRSTGVVLKDAAIIAVDQSATLAPTYGSTVNIPGNIIAGIRSRGEKPIRRIINKANAVVKAGEMCLVLGRPGAGCSSLLKTIAGEGLDQYQGTEGSISFDGVPQEEMLKHYKNDIIYNPELDVHFPHLTVQQTLKFAVGCKVPKVRVNAVTDNASVKQYVDFKTDMLATIFGLRHTYNTKVGNDFVRGVSGGERKRVSIAEALAADAKVYCWDNATRGLDASTALEYASAIRVLTNLLDATNFVTIYQASENIYEKFDKVLVLYEGRQVYFGPVHEAKQYFEDMGYACPKRQATPEFLTAITDPKGRSAKPGYENKVPRTAMEFEQYWHNSPEFKKLSEEIDQYEQQANADQTKQLFMESSKLEKKKAKSTYTVSYAQQLKLNFVRSYQVAVGDFSYLATQITADIIQALITGSLYYNIPHSTAGAFSRGGILFFSILYYSLAGLASVSNSFGKRPILLKQKGYSFCHPSTEFFSSFVVDAMFKILGVIPFVIINFFLAKLKQTAGNFFVIFLFVILASFTMNAFFQMIALVSPGLPVANSISGLIVLASVAYSCFMIQLPSMHPWFKWINWLNPVRYGFESMMVNEFHHVNMTCSAVVPSGPGYEGASVANQVCAFAGSTPGSVYVNGDNYLKLGFDYAFDHLWRNFGILLGFLVFFLSVSAIASEYMKTDVAGYDVLIFKKTKETLKIMAGKRQAMADDEKPELQDASLSMDVEKQAEATSKVFDSLGSKDLFLWQHVDYDVTLKTGEVRRLLNDVQGYVKPGTLTALMGESGAGKTTLLNTLSQRVDMGVITGDMLVNGKPLGSSFKRKTGYVQQQDVHFSELTVRESLRFAANLRRSRSIPKAEKYEYVEQIISILNMNSYADAVVGEPGFGLNVEQRKKLSIGVELVAKPSLLLFLDEPTSGLDSQSSWSIVKLMRDLANAGQAILCTIHQPSAVLFEEFDRLLLLKKGGHTVYFGEIGDHSRTMLDYFERSGARKCQDDENPAEYILEAIGAGATASVKEDWGDIWRSSPEFSSTTSEIAELIKTSSANHTEEDPEMKKTFITPYHYQLRLVVGRVATQFWRDPTYLMAKMMLMMFAGLFIGFTYWDAGHSVIGMQNLMFSVFMSIVISAPLIHQIQARALQSREVYEVRESKSNTYHWSTLLLAQYINELPYHLIFSTIFFVAFYFPIHRNYDSYTVGTYYLFYTIMFQLYYVSFGLWIVYMSPNLPAAAVLVSLFLSFMIAFCGVVQPPTLMPGFWTFMWKVSPYTYFIQSFMILSLHKLKIKCKKSEFSIVEPPSGQTCATYLDPFAEAAGGYINNPSATSNCEYCAYKVGDQYLSHIEVKSSYLWRNFGFLWVYVGFNLVAMVSSYWFFRVRKGSLINIKSIFSKFQKKSK
ncbi:ATP-binding cassette transporter [Saccharomycopsis crataegensis]|uniref:ATP-binding cassette transporter n=1 Tax=Saccharomycopsis crataegensis TaxID=43959 RepID=A0AAV5QKJ3_9ASCO|nr:ATP-binding cassette transporter [Saccharomycopsis crataegensis]